MPRMRRPTARRGWPVALLALLLTACDIITFAPAPAAEPPTSAAGQIPAATPTPGLAALPADELLRRALRARELGDYDAAALDLRALLDAHPQAAEALPASFYLAESFALRGRWTSAVEALRSFLGDQPPAQPDELYARGLFLLARGHEQAGAWADAVAAYQRYRALKTPLEPYARLREAAQQAALGQAAEAAAGYEAVAGGAIVAGERAGAYEKAIALRVQLGQKDAALALYRKLLGLATQPEYRARILRDAAGLAAELGAADDARAWRREIAERAPATPQALEALDQLKDDPEGAVDPLVAARVYAAHEQWSAALPLYDAAIAAASGDDALELRRQRALAARGAGDFAAALDQLAAIGAEAPNSPPGRQAQLDWIQTRGQSGDTQAAIDGYRQFADAYPDDERAPEALSRAATLLARAGDADGATQQQLDLGRRYPASGQAHDALYEAGWSLFRANRHEEARAAWEALTKSSAGIVAAQASFWAARTYDKQAPEYAKLLDAAIEAAPDSYYAARAAELRGHAPTGRVPPGAPIEGASWRQAEDWIAGWSGRPAYHVDERGYPPEVAQAGAVQRAIALQDVGLQPESIAEWNAARADWADDPVKLYLLARVASDHGASYIALKAAEDVAKRSPDAGFARAPEALRRLIFPTPYSELLVAAAHERGLDPLALYAMLRQESLFNPAATSGAGALGLAQVMPGTAEGIAQNLKLAEFAETDLYRPAVSIRFGAFYLGHQLAAMNGSLPAALAAYNGGPGNAERWAGGDTVADPDLFTEAIDYAETQGYVRLVYGYYGAYRRLYAAP
jgi:soluble lytic murein transglycosylase